MTICCDLWVWRNMEGISARFKNLKSLQSFSVGKPDPQLWADTTSLSNFKTVCYAANVHLPPINVGEHLTVNRGVKERFSVTRGCVDTNNWPKVISTLDTPPPPSKKSPIWVQSRSQSSFMHIRYNVTINRQPLPKKDVPLVSAFGHNRAPLMNHHRLVSVRWFRERERNGRSLCTLVSPAE